MWYKLLLTGVVVLMLKFMSSIVLTGLKTKRMEQAGQQRDVATGNHKSEVWAMLAATLVFIVLVLMNRVFHVLPAIHDKLYVFHTRTAEAFFLIFLITAFRFNGTRTKKHRIFAYACTFALFVPTVFTGLWLIWRP